MSLFRTIVADDNDDIRWLICQSLARHDAFELIAEARTGEEAVALSGQHRPDLVLLDIKMPGMGGEAAAPEIVEASPETKVVMLSATFDGSPTLEEAPPGAFGALPKEPPFGELMDRLRGLLEEG